MSEWWTYRAEDFLMFSPSAYWRLMALHNAQWWPWHVLVLSAGAALLLGLCKRWPHAGRAGAALLSALTFFVAWTFVELRYGQINWAAYDMAFVLAASSIALAMLATRDLYTGWACGLRRPIGIGLMVFALLGQPAVALLLSRPLAQAEWLGLMPDPTVLAVLAWLLCTRRTDSQQRVAGWMRAVVWIISIAWCLTSAATLATMGSVQAWVPLVAALLAVGVGVSDRAERGVNPSRKIPSRLG